MKFTWFAVVNELDIPNNLPLRNLFVSHFKVSSDDCGPVSDQRLRRQITIRHSFNTHFIPSVLPKMWHRSYYIARNSNNTTSQGQKLWEVTAQVWASGLSLAPEQNVFRTATSEATVRNQSHRSL